ncbi:MAG: type II secretion system secretin GspD [Cytophagales bacterium]|nr:type II secretion system secretin GspD [Cytophagales bacterium]
MKQFLILMSLALCLATGVLAQPKKSDKSAAKTPVTLNFVNAEIDAVARTVATLTNRNVVVDPRVKGTMNLSTERPVSAGEAFNQFLSALRLQGFTVVESGGLYKVVPEADAKLQGGESTVVAPGESSRAMGNQIVTQIFKLNFESANNLVPILRPLISPNNTINVNAGNNSLIITDYRENLSRMARIIAAMDVSSATDLEIIPVKNGVASDLATLVSKLLESSGTSTAAVAPATGPAQSDTTFKTTVVPEPRSNALIVRAANPARLSLAKSLIRQLDQPPADGSSNGAAGNIYVVHLKNAEAAKLAITLRAALQATAVTGNSNNSFAGSAGGATAASTVASGSAATAPIAASAVPSTGGQIQADPATNSLIITAPEPQYRQLRAVIDKLDVRRAQVFVESLIAEVNTTKAAAFGVQWQSAVGSKGNTNIGFLGTNFGTGGSNILALGAGAAAGTVAPAAGLNIGVAHQTNGVYVLGALANFLETTGDGNVLSTPNLLTLDNEEAKIVVGQNVPFLTGQYTNNSSGSTTNPFQTIERKDVGITLRIKPQISENGTIKMTIFQEVSSVDPASKNSATGLVTNKRSLESNVVVDDGVIVVLGGLLQDTQSSNQSRVPGLASIPFLGALFRSENKSREKTNLMVFLRPVIVRDGASTEALSLERYQNMRGLQLDQVEQDKLNSGRFNYGVPVMPETPPDVPTIKP